MAIERFSPNFYSSMQTPVIQAEQLTKKFGEEYAVREVTFQVPQGKIFGFIGPSGSGKTTVVRLMTGICAPTAGRATVLGMSPEHFRQNVRQKIGYMPQLFALYPDLTVRENLNFSASLYGMWLFRRKKINELLDFVELRKDDHKLTSKISGGMQRRLSLACTLIHKPDLIFLDEPTAGIDPVLRRKFWDYFKMLHEQGRTLFVTTQYVSEAAYCDLVGVMANGKLVMVETPDGLRHRAFGGDVVDLHIQNSGGVAVADRLKQFPFLVGDVKLLSDGGYRMVVREAKTAVPALMEWCSQNKIEVRSVEEYLPPYDDIFVALVKDQQREEENV